jgi:hypothetical protein
MAASGSLAAVLNAGMATFQFAHTHTKNLLVHTEALKPLESLMEKVRSWEMAKNG